MYVPQRQNKREIAQQEQGEQQVKATRTWPSLAPHAQRSMRNKKGGHIWHLSM